MKKVLIFFLISLLISVPAFAEKWTCTGCGDVQSGNFCSNCGTKRPETWLCPTCGYNATDAYCCKCGTKRPVTYARRTTRETWQGEGYDTPENAFLAFMNAYADSDAYGMLSVFAVESYVDHLDRDQYVKDLGSFTTVFVMQQIVPAPDDFSKAIQVINRAGYIANQIQYIQIQRRWKPDIYEGAGQYYDGEQLSYSKGEGPAAAFMQLMNQPESHEIKFDSFLNVSEYCPNYESEASKANFAKMAKRYGAQEMTSLCAVVMIDDEKYIWSMDFVKYGDTGSWYALRLNGTAGSWLGVGGMTYGLERFEDVEILNQ